MEEVLIDILLDTIKILPYLFIAFLILELIEHKLSNKNTKLLKNNKKYGPLFGGLLGGLPQCGFASIAANLFSKRVITIGTLISVFLATSDEMLPIMISENVELTKIFSIIGLKIIIGIIIGIIVDLIIKRKDNDNKNEIHKMCEHDHCDCKTDGVFLSSIKHTIKIGLFILLANLLISIIIYYVGEDNLSNILLNKNIFTYFIASLVGLIPNCASSVVITELYLEELITIGTLYAGLLTGSGIGILLLFKTNKNLKENITILSIIYFIGVLFGVIIDLVI